MAKILCTYARKLNEGKMTKKEDANKQTGNHMQESTAGSEKKASGEKKTASKKQNKQKKGHDKKIKSLEAKINELEGALEKEKQAKTELENKYMRLIAEYDNYRKRTLKEKMELRQSANEKLLFEILPVMDDFERAIKAFEENNKAEAAFEGVKLIYGKFADFLKQQGVTSIDAMGKEFNTDAHEAVTKIPVEEKKQKGKVVDVIQKGYYLNEKILRYSKVVVGE